MRIPSTSPFPGVVIPAEAAPYCDHRGFINWRKVALLVAHRLGIEPASIWTYQLSKILHGESEDCYNGTLAIMRELKLDQIVNSVALDPQSKIQRNSNAKAARYAENFGIPLDRVVGSGPDGMILKRDVVSHRRGLKMGQINVVAADRRLLRQRRILADHLRECIRTKRGLEVLLDDQWNRHQREISELNDRLAAASRALAEAVEQRISAQARADKLLDIIEAHLRTPKPVTLVERARKFLQALRPHKTQKAATA